MGRRHGASSPLSFRSLLAREWLAWRSLPGAMGPRKRTFSPGILPAIRFAAAAPAHPRPPRDGAAAAASGARFSGPPVPGASSVEGKGDADDAQERVTGDARSLGVGSSSHAGSATPSYAAPGTPGYCRSRSDEPSMSFTRRGSKALALEAAATPASRQAAMELLIRDQDASSSGTKRQQDLALWEELHSAWFEDACPPFPLVELKLMAVAAMIKHGRYRSGRGLLSRAKDRHIELGFTWTDGLDRACRRVGRSVTRGIGPARQSAGYPLDEVAELPCSDEAAVPGGPIDIVGFIVCGSLFCARELEASTARLANFTLDLDRRVVSWNLPADKTDPQALGKRRSWECICEGRGGPCAYCFSVRHMRILESVFGVGLSGDFPLFPNEKGEFVAKDLVVKSFKAVAAGLNLPVRTPEGYELWGGHSLRVTGARWLASRGVALLTIQ